MLTAAGETRITTAAAGRFDTHPTPATARGEHRSAGLEPSDLRPSTGARGGAGWQVRSDHNRKAADALTTTPAQLARRKCQIRGLMA